MSGRRPAQVTIHTRVAHGLAAVSILCASALHCTVTNALYCDKQTPCADPSQTCDEVAHACGAMTPDNDMSAPGGDMALPDLLPPCTATSCQSAAPICDVMDSGACRRCTDSRDDRACAARSAQTPRCDPASGTCGACRADTQTTDCSQPVAPICDHGACRGCRAHAECASAICKLDGSCADTKDIAYVDNMNGNCIGPSHLGTRADPRCEVNEGAHMGKPFVLVAGSTAVYSDVFLDGISVTIVGPGRGAMPAATLPPIGGVGFQIQNSGTVVIDGMTVAKSSQWGISCGGQGQGVDLTVVRSEIRDNNIAGINASTCKLTLDGNLITGNAGPGVSVSNSIYNIRNNIIAHNFTAGMQMYSGSSGRFQFNTIANNGSGYNYGGVECPNDIMGARLIESSIVWGNMPRMGGSTQFSPGCSVQNVVTGMDTQPGAIMQTPDFVSAMNAPFDYHLKPASMANRACCVDRLSPGDGGAPDWPDRDVDGSHRPKGVGWDIGAHEVE